MSYSIIIITPEHWAEYKRDKSKGFLAKLIKKLKDDGVGQIKKLKDDSAADPGIVLNLAGLQLDPTDDASDDVKFLAALHDANQLLQAVVFKTRIFVRAADLLTTPEFLEALKENRRLPQEGEIREKKEDEVMAQTAVSIIDIKKMFDTQGVPGEFLNALETNKTIKAVIFQNCIWLRTVVVDEIRNAFEDEILRRVLRDLAKSYRDKYTYPTRLLDFGHAVPSEDFFNSTFYQMFEFDAVAFGNRLLVKRLGIIKDQGFLHRLHQSQPPCYRVANTPIDTLDLSGLLKESGDEGKERARNAEAVIPLLKALKTNTQIVRLNLSGAIWIEDDSYFRDVASYFKNELSDALIEFIKDNGILREIGLADTNIKSQFLKKLAEALSDNTTLKCLDISGNRSLYCMWEEWTSRELPPCDFSGLSALANLLQTSKTLGNLSITLFFVFIKYGSRPFLSKEVVAGVKKFLISLACSLSLQKLKLALTCDGGQGEAACAEINAMAQMVLAVNRSLLSFDLQPLYGGATFRELLGDIVEKILEANRAVIEVNGKREPRDEDGEVKQDLLHARNRKHHQATRARVVMQAFFAANRGHPFVTSVAGPLPELLNMVDDEFPVIKASKELAPVIAINKLPGARFFRRHMEEHVPLPNFVASEENAQLVQMLDKMLEKLVIRVVRNAIGFLLKEIRDPSERQEEVVKQVAMSKQCAGRANELRMLLVYSKPRSVAYLENAVHCLKEILEKRSPLIVTDNELKQLLSGEYHMRKRENLRQPCR